MELSGMGGQNAGTDRADPRMTYSCLWPGLCAVWFQGDWRGLGTAMAFAALLNATILTTLVWDEWLGAAAGATLWSATTVFWLAGFACNRRVARCVSQPVDDRARPGDLFPQALTEYLKGNWIGVEQACREMIDGRRDDAEARLLLASALRRCGRIDEARRALNELAKFDAARRWSFEIAEERSRLEEARTLEAETAATEPAAGGNSAGEAIRRAA